MSLLNWFTHNATIGVHVELDMAKRFLSTGNGEEVARVGPKVDFRENFDPLERDVDQVQVEGRLAYFVVTMGRIWTSDGEDSLH